MIGLEALVQVGHGFEQMLYQLVAYLIAGAVVFLFLQLLIYSTITVSKYKRSRSLKKAMPSWSRYIDSYLRRGKRAGIIELDAQERTLFRDLLIALYSGSSQDPSNPEIVIEKSLSESDRRRLRLLYREIGYVIDDMAIIENGSAWEKAIALGRLSRLELNDAEDHAVDLLDDDNNDLVISCISYLTSIQSRFLSTRLPELISSCTDSHFRELMYELLGSDIDMKHILELAGSADSRCRMAAAILVGRKGLNRGARLLKPLSRDPDANVRAHAARSLSRIGTTSAAKVLEDMVWDTDEIVGDAVEESMESIPVRKHLPSIWDRPLESPSIIDDLSRGNTMGPECWKSDSIMG